ncbi:MAG: Gfo/Idh/MocA family oxidoreductase, partial [Anaerolineae bacterium]
VLRFKNGAIGTINTTTACWPGGGDTLTVYGTNGTIATAKQRDHLEIWKFRDDADGSEEREMMSLYGVAERGEGATVATDPRATGLHGHQPIFADMIEAIRQNRDPFITGRSARRPVAIVTAIYESCRTGKEVKIEG